MSAQIESFVGSVKNFPEMCSVLLDRARSTEYSEGLPIRYAPEMSTGGGHITGLAEVFINPSMDVAGARLLEFMMRDQSTANIIPEAMREIFNTDYAKSLIECYEKTGYDFGQVGASLMDHVFCEMEVDSWESNFTQRQVELFRSRLITILEMQTDEYYERLLSDIFFFQYMRLVPWHEQYHNTLGSSYTHALTINEVISVHEAVELVFTTATGLTRESYHATVTLRDFLPIETRYESARRWNGEIIDVYLANAPKEIDPERIREYSRQHGIDELAVRLLEIARFAPEGEEIPTDIVIETLQEEMLRGYWCFGISRLPDPEIFDLMKTHFDVCFTYQQAELFIEEIIIPMLQCKVVS